MGKISIAVYRAKPGKDEELKQLIADRMPFMRKLGLVTDRPNITMRARNGEFIDVSEWVDDAAIKRAHETPEVLEMWARFEAYADYLKLDSLEEAHEEFGGFEAI